MGEIGVSMFKKYVNMLYLNLRKNFSFFISYHRQNYSHFGPVNRMLVNFKNDIDFGNFCHHINHLILLFIHYCRIFFT